MLLGGKKPKPNKMKQKTTKTDTLLLRTFPNSSQSASRVMRWTSWRRGTRSTPVTSQIAGTSTKCSSCFPLQQHRVQAKQNTAGQMKFAFFEVNWTKK